MPNIIKFPLYNSGVTLLDPKYCFVNVDGLFDVIQYVQLFGDSDVRVGFEFVYLKDWGGLSVPDRHLSVKLLYQGVDLQVSDWDVEIKRLKKLIKNSSARTNSQPKFYLLDNDNSTEEPFIHHVFTTYGSVWLPPA